MGSTETKAKRPPRRSRSFAADAFVLLAMTLTTVALAIGLYLQFRLAFWLAVVAALSVYVGLLALHALVRRSEKVERLTAEIERLETELNQVASGAKPAAGGMVPPMNGTVAGPVAGAVAGPAVASSVGAMPSRNVPQGPPSNHAPMPQMATASSAAQVAQRPAPPPASSYGPRGETMADAPAMADAPHDAARRPRPSPPAEAAERGVSDRAVDAIMNDYWAFRPSQPPRLPEQPTQATGPAGRSEDIVASSVQPPPMPTAKASPAMPSSPRQTDVDMIGGLIKKMADEINAVEADRLRHPAGSDRVPSAVIEASVNALRTTADQMRGSAVDTEYSRAKPEATPASQRLRAALPAAPQPAVWGDMSAPVAEAPAAERPDAARTGAVTAEVEPPRDALPVVVQRPPLPPPLPPSQPAAQASSQHAPQHKHIAPHRHTMDRPAARALPPHAVADGYAPMPWPDDVDAAPPAPPATIAHSRLAALAEAITAGRLDVLLDPILGLADQRARHFEVSVRLKDKNGQVLEPPDSVPELRDSGLLPLLDCARIQRSAQVASRLADRGKPGSLFSAFSGEALSHDQFLADFADLYSTREGLATQLVLSFGQADVRGFAGRDWDTIAEMRELGFRFALQSITDLDMDIEALKTAGFDFVKLDASVFLEGMPASGGVVPAGDICRHLAQLGMTLIVGQIEDEAQLARIFGFGVIYGQGQLFGGARPMKSEALSEAGHAAA